MQWKDPFSSSAQVVKVARFASQKPQENELDD